jgi:hypothetical protein
MGSGGVGGGHGVGRCQLCQHVFWPFSWGRAFLSKFSQFWGILGVVRGIFEHFFRGILRKKPENPASAFWVKKIA